MILSFKVGTLSARKYHVCQLRKLPRVGEVFAIVDKTVHGSQPFRVRLTDVRVRMGGDDVYFVELW